MKTKEEVIKEAWGIHWDKMDKRGQEQALEDNGYCHKNYVNSEIDFEIESLPCPDNEFIRPKSLQGIENNNGWIRIESEADLPIDNGGSYIVCEKGIPREEYQMPRESLAKGWSCGVITHYKPIVKHKKPLY